MVCLESPGVGDIFVSQGGDLKSVPILMAFAVVCGVPQAFARKAPARPAAPTGALTTGGVTFYGDVLRILQTHCQVCHREGEIGPMPLGSYEQVRPGSRGPLPRPQAKEKCRPGLRIEASAISRTILRSPPPKSKRLPPGLRGMPRRAIHTTLRRFANGQAVG